MSVGFFSVLKSFGAKCSQKAFAVSCLADSGKYLFGLVDTQKKHCKYPVKLHGGKKYVDFSCDFFQKMFDITKVSIH